MTLRKRTMTVVGLTVAVMIVALYAIANFSLHQGFQKVETNLVSGFTKVENNDTHKNVQRVCDAMSSKIDFLSTKLADWAQWDDTYQFVQDLNAKYRESNLNASSLATLKINFFSLHDATGKNLFSWAYDQADSKTIPLPDGIEALLKPGSMLLTHKDESSAIAGLLMLPGKALLIASRPILKSDGKGPIHGTIMFGQFLDEAELKRLQDVTHLAISVHRWEAKDLADELKTAREELSGKRQMLLRLVDAKTISGFTTIKDIAGNPALLLRVDIPRDIYQQGQKTLAEVRSQGQATLITVTSGVLLACFILGVVILMIIERFVLSRLGRLSHEAAAIGENQDFTARVEVKGQDELAGLAQSLNTMLGSLSESHQAIEKRNAEMRLLMNTLPVGLVAINDSFHINPEFSRMAGVILGRQDLAEQDYFDVLGLSAAERPEDREKLKSFLEVLRDGIMADTELAELNPFETFELAAEGGSSRWLKLRYFLIERGAGQPSHVLVVMEDITTEKALERQVENSQQENLQLKAILEDPELFREFLVEAGATIAQVRHCLDELATAENPRELIHEAFRGVHTIKGVAGAFLLHEVSTLSGRLEDYLSPLREADRIQAEQIAASREGLETLALALDGVRQYARTILGDDVAEDSGVTLRISLEALKQNIAAVESILDRLITSQETGNLRQEIIPQISTLKCVPAGRALARATRIVPGLIQRLGKCATFQFEGQETPIDCEVAQELNTPLVHLIRNAFDHGIESPEERAENAKPEEAQVRLMIQREPGHIRIDLSDDGGGIDAERIRAAAVEKGLVTAEEAARLNPAECYELMFRPGFTTMRNVTDVSGRGVGLDAVHESICNALHGTIEVKSVVGQGTCFHIEIPMAEAV